MMAERSLDAEASILPLLEKAMNHTSSVCSRSTCIPPVSFWYLMYKLVAQSSNSPRLFHLDAPSIALQLLQWLR